MPAESWPSWLTCDWALHPFTLECGVKSKLGWGWILSSRYTAFERKRIAVNSRSHFHQQCCHAGSRLPAHPLIISLVASLGWPPGCGYPASPHVLDLSFPSELQSAQGTQAFSLRSLTLNWDNRPFGKLKFYPIFTGPRKHVLGVPLFSLIHTAIFFTSLQHGWKAKENDSLGSVVQTENPKEIINIHCYWYYFFVFLRFIFNWRVHCCVGLCHTSAWIRHRYTHVPSLLNLPPTSLPIPLLCCWVASVVSDSVQPHRRQLTRLHRPWDSPGKNTGGGCHFLLQFPHLWVVSIATTS